MPEWNPESEALLAEMVKTETWGSIAARFETTIDAVRYKAQTLGLKKEILNKADPGLDFRVAAFSEEHGIRATSNHYDLSKDEVKNARRRIKDRRERARLILDRDNFMKLRRMCIAYATSNKSSYDAEDFAHWAVLELIEGKSSGLLEKLEKNQWIFVNHLFLRYIREIVGHKDSGTYEARKQLASPLGTLEHVSKELVLDGPTRPKIFDIASALKLEFCDRMIFLLYFREGLTEYEIADYIDKSQPSVHRALVEIKQRLIENAEAKELLNGLA